MKNKKKIIKNNAVAGVIEALLLIGLVAIILSLIQLYYIPEIMESIESEHMDQISNQYSNLKSIIEIQSTMGVINSDSDNPKPIAYTSISSPIALGTNPLPYFVTIGSTGSVNLIDEDESGKYRINISGCLVTDPQDPLNCEPIKLTIPLTSLKYIADNNYYLNGADLIYALEGGGIILKQPDGESMKVYPAINIVNYTFYTPDYDKIEMNWNIIKFKGTIGKKNFNNGFGNPSEICYVRTNYIDHEEYNAFIELRTNVTDYIHIYTDYTTAWSESLTQNGIGLLYEYVKNNYVEVKVDELNHCVIITPGTKYIKLYLTVVEIGVQVGPGTILKTS